MGVKNDSFDLFFRRKPAMMLIALKKVSRAKYGSQLAKEVDCTYLQYNYRVYQYILENFPQ